jgi:hypothetical protein
MVCAFFQSNRTWRDYIRWLFFFAFYAIFSNLPFLAASHFLPLVRNGWFCLDYACLGLLALFLPRILSAVLLFSIITADIVSAVSLTYYLTPANCLDNFGLLREMPVDRLLMAIGITLLMLLVSAAVVFLPIGRIREKCRWHAALSLLGFIVLLLVLDSTTLYRQTGRFPASFQASQSDDILNTTQIGHFRKDQLCRFAL